MQKPNTSFYITIALLVIVIIFIFLGKSRLQQHGILLNAKTTTWVTSAKLSMELKYEFYYQGKGISEENAFEPFRGNPDFENRYFPVIYYPRLGGHSQLLIRPSDFEEFGIPFPDSLNWVLPYLK